MDLFWGLQGEERSCNHHLIINSLFLEDSSSHFYLVAVAWATLLLIATSIYAYRMAPIVSDPFFVSDLGSYLAGRSNISFHRLWLINIENKCRVWFSVFQLLLIEVQDLRRLLRQYLYLIVAPLLGCTFLAILLAYCDFLEPSDLVFLLQSFFPC